MSMTASTGPGVDTKWAPGFNEYLLGGIVVMSLVGLLIAGAFYLLPPSHLQLTELQPVFRVSEVSKFPINASRVVSWGEEIVLVVRTDEQSFAAVAAVAPNDGCILRWDPTSLRILSPCSYLVYDLHGNVVRGLTTVPLRRFTVFVNDGVAYVTRS